MLQDFHQNEKVEGPPSEWRNRSQIPRRHPDPSVEGYRTIAIDVGWQLGTLDLHTEVICENDLNKPEANTHIQPAPSFLFEQRDNCIESRSDLPQVTENAAYMLLGGWNPLLGVDTRIGSVVAMRRECILSLYSERHVLDKVIDFWIQDRIFGLTNVKDHFGENLKLRASQRLT